MSDAPDYAHYSLDDLKDARRHVDVDRYPEQAEAIDAEISVRELMPPDTISGHQGDTIPTSKPKPSSSPASTLVVVLRRVLSLPVLGFGALLLMTASVSWLAFFETFFVGILLTALYGGAALILLAAGLGLWGSRYREIVAGVILIGVGLQVGLIATFTGLMLTDYLGPLVPDDYDSPTSRRMTVGSAFSALVLVTFGTILLVAQIRHAMRSRNKVGQAG